MATNEFPQGFKAVVAKATVQSSVIRWLFIKQHKVREPVPGKPTDRTLFVINVPPFCDETALAYTFSVCGEVTDVFCHARPNPGVPQQSSGIFNKRRELCIYKVAYIVFESPEGLSRALALNNDMPLILHCEQSGVKLGIEKWMDKYDSALLNHNELETEIKTFMVEFDAEEKRKEHEAKMVGEADEEGWIMVTNKSRKRGIARTEVIRKKILDKEKLKRSKRELKNFYTFQIRESKMKHLETLRKKFQEDKKKINAFKQTRKFKPF
ncbi:Ribosomal RNA-processing protein 7-like protein A [Gryllus bimaculatus]|nr:Ribosomal RNA-processing protein 7-like protein A [Gryllus bimaculatus]